MRFAFIAAALGMAAAFVAAPLPEAAAQGVVTTLNGNEIPARSEDGSRNLLLRRSDVAVPSPVLGYDAPQRLVLIATAQGRVWVRESDVLASGLGAAGPGGCQPGDAPGQCRKSYADVCRTTPTPPWCASRSGN